MEAAARVAARYANAPSYSDLLGSEARAALRAAEAASEAALQAKAAARSVLAGIEAANAAAPMPEPVLAPLPPSGRASHHFAERSSNDFALSPSDEFFDWQNAPAPDSVDLEPAGLECAVFESAALEPVASAVVADAGEPVAEQPLLERPVSVIWDLDLPARPAEPVDVRAVRGRNPLANRSEDWWRPGAVEREVAEPEPIEVEPAQPIPANLIEFPRELVATRRVRPRLVESPQSAAASTQLSIFEVDPISLSTEPMIELPAGMATDLDGDLRLGPAPSLPARSSADAKWIEATWPGMELEAHPALGAAEEADAPVPQRPAALAIAPAPLSLRLMALIVDGALIAGSVVGAALMAASHSRVLPGLRTTEIGVGIALILAAAVYETLFFTLGRATPGMAYARIRLATFEGGAPVRAERCKRLAAQLVSVLPMGLGLAWSLFDDDHLSWHDRLSRTCLCKR